MACAVHGTDAATVQGQRGFPNSLSSSGSQLLLEVMPGEL